MDFKSRFKGKMTAIGKSGVTAIIQSPSLPIIKQYHLSPSVSPIMKFANQRETKSLVFTNIRNGMKTNQSIFKRAMKAKTIKTEDEVLDLTKYQIVAIPKIYTERYQPRSHDVSPVYNKKYQYF